MPGHEGHVIAHRPQPLHDRVEQLLMITARKIGAADRTLKEHIAHDRQTAGCMKEHHMTRGVAGAVGDLQIDIAKVHGIALLEPAI